jgi:hypothetical protein
MLREDILFSCDLPIPGTSSSTSRKPTFSLSERPDQSNADIMLNKVYYLTKTFFMPF